VLELDVDDLGGVLRLARDDERLGETQRDDAGRDLHGGTLRTPAPVAQGIERAPPEREVAGSIPAGRKSLGSPTPFGGHDDFLGAPPETRW
jgi:hypothetical protein